MYFRKYFEGSLPSNASGSVTINGTTTKKTVYTTQTQVINNAIKETLQEAGIECGYTGADTGYVLTVLGAQIQLLSLSSNGCISLYRKGNASEMFTAASSAATFSGLNYKFFVSLLGDPKGILVIYLGNYSSPAALGYGVSIFQLTDLRDGSRKIGVSTYSPSSVYVYTETGDIVGGINSLSFQNLVNNVDLTQNGARIPLVESIDTTGFFSVRQCYRGHGGLAANNFYNIGGDIYMQFYILFLIKCTTEV